MHYAPDQHMQTKTHHLRSNNALVFVQNLSRVRLHLRCSERSFSWDFSLLAKAPASGRKTKHSATRGPSAYTKTVVSNVMLTHKQAMPGIRIASNANGPAVA